ncbi:MAG TPA: helix-turn-helix transcriptional regulator [Kofleriaceae bacterium]|nr:helix-turn-helix transcriptional regulator [Kofleriaceae bacterium]
MNDPGRRTSPRKGGPAQTGGPEQLDRRQSFCDYLRQGREARSMSLEDIARVTRIPERSLERLERGEFEALPADVFVRGFLRSYAQCVGLDADDALRRYGDCGLTPSPVAQLGKRRATTSREELAEGTPAPELLRAPPLARGSVALEPTVLAPSPAAMPVAASVAAREEPETESTPATSSNQSSSNQSSSNQSSKKKRKQRRKRKTPRVRVDAEQRDISVARDVSVARDICAAIDPAPAAAATAEPVVAEPVSAEPNAPVAAPAGRAVAPARMVIAIDDEAPDDAERVLSERTERDTAEREASRRAFLPPALLDHEDGSRRGALTLAVIILVIVATLTMSYLLRRPSSSGSGVTELTWGSEPVQPA